MENVEKKENLSQNAKSISFALISAFTLFFLYVLKELIFSSINSNEGSSFFPPSFFFFLTLSILFYVCSLISGIIGIRLVSNDLDKKEYANKFEFIICAAIYYITVLIVPMIMLFMFWH